MQELTRLTWLIACVVWMTGTGSGVAAQTTITVKGESWDSDSLGFAFYQALSVTAGTKKAARRGSRVSVDGQPQSFAIAGPGGKFEITFTTEGVDISVGGGRRPFSSDYHASPTKYRRREVRSMSDRYGRLDSKARNTPGHYRWSQTRLDMTRRTRCSRTTMQPFVWKVLGSGADGAPEWTDNVTLSFPASPSVAAEPVATSRSPFLERIPQPQYAIPFDMNKVDTFFYEQDRS